MLLSGDVSDDCITTDLPGRARARFFFHRINIQIEVCASDLVLGRTFVKQIATLLIKFSVLGGEVVFRNHENLGNGHGTNFNVW